MSSIVLALSVFNLLLVSTGLLLVYFDWSAARRREFLYLYLTDEKPDQSYFIAARRRRAQYTRFIAAFGALLLRQIFAVALVASVLPPDTWNTWTRWWNTHAIPFRPTPPGEVPPSIAFATELHIWVLMFEILGLALIALAFLYGARPRLNSRLDLCAGVWAGVWLLLVPLAAFHAWGDKTAHMIALIANGARLLVAGSALWLLLGAPAEREVSEAAQSVPLSSPRMIAWGFAAWLVGALLAVLSGEVVFVTLALTIAFFVFVSLIAKEVLGEYETMETSRHRLGRERQVIFSYLERIGAAFTRALQIDEVLAIILESALSSTEAQAGAIYLLNANSGKFEPRVVMNFFPPLHVDTPTAKGPNRTPDLKAEMKAQAFSVGEGVIGEVAAALQGRLIQDVRASNVMLGSTTDFMRNRSMLLVPLRVGDAAIGVMTVVNKNRGSFTNDDQSLLQSLADQSALSINNAILTAEVGKQERIRRELQIARDIQQRLLPKECPLVPGFEIGARGTSATEVGGDYYDFFWVDENRLGIVVADVSGKGVHAALIVAMIKSAFRAVASGNGDVKDVLSRVNEFISEDLRRDMFVTCIYGILDVPQRSFSWARAGHEPIIVTHPSHQTDVFSPDGFALGILPSMEFRDLLEVQTVQLQSGDRLLLFTDGLTEAMNSDGEEFGMERILHVMEHPDAAPAHGAKTVRVEAGSNAGGVGTNVAGAQVALPKTKSEKKADARSDASAKFYAPSIQDGSPEPHELQSIERAVQDHVGDAPQSDDLTMVYLAAM